jgi:hypothetical protein
MILYYSGPIRRGLELRSRESYHLEEVITSETSVNLYQNTRRSTPNDSSLRTGHRENLKSQFNHNLLVLFWLSETQSFVVLEVTGFRNFISEIAAYFSSLWWRRNLMVREFSRSGN